MTSPPVLAALIATLVTLPAYAGPQAVSATAAPANLATIEGITVKGQRCTLASPGCACRERDRACVLAVAEDMRLYFPREYRAMAARCLHDDTLLARYRIEVANGDSAPAQVQPGFAAQIEEPGAHKAFCDKAYADVRAATHR